MVLTDTDHGMDREYRLSLNRTLFGEWEVEIAWGRRGRLGRRKIERCGDRLADAIAAARRRVGRRRSARRRLGAAYRVVGIEGPASIAEELRLREGDEVAG